MRFFIERTAFLFCKVNAFRYRGYYYDTETGYYYLQSRYYDPNVGRFISADDVEYLGADGTPLSYNLYAYCLNDPINFMDPRSGKPFEKASDAYEYYKENVKDPKEKAKWKQFFKSQGWRRSHMDLPHK